jgi:hypothetical protein
MYEKDWKEEGERRVGIRGEWLAGNGEGRIWGDVGWGL